MTGKKPLILLTNDDGIYAEGLLALHNTLKTIADVVIVAPLTEQSAVGHAITLCDPIRVIELSKNPDELIYAVKGTPADCVKIAVRALLDRKPDVVISGINSGSNTAINVLYSGTVSAATEGTILGIPSAAISLSSYNWQDYSVAAEIGKNIALNILTNGMPEDTILNVNVPAVNKDQITGIQITRQGISRFKEFYDKKIDPRGRVYYWLTGDMHELDEHDPQTDVEAIKNNAVSITPIKIQLTNEIFLDKLKQWKFSL